MANDREDPRFRHLRVKIGAFIVVAALVIATTPIIIGKNNDLFIPKYHLRFTVEKGTGFTKGMPVKLSGFRIGKVKSISLNDAAKVDVVLQLDKKYQKWIRTDSQAKLVKEGLVGDMIVEVSVGSNANPIIGNNDVLAYTKTKSLDELADDIAEKVKPVLVEVSNIISYVNDPRGDIKQSMKNFNLLARNLEVTRQKADSLLVKSTSEGGALSVKLQNVLDDASVTVKSAHASLILVENKLPGLMVNAENSLASIEKISKDLKEAEEKVLPKVPPLVRNVNDTLYRTNGVLEAVTGIWPISSQMIPPQERQFVPGDSYD